MFCMRACVRACVLLCVCLCIYFSSSAVTEFVQEDSQHAKILKGDSLDRSMRYILISIQLVFYEAIQQVFVSSTRASTFILEVSVA